MAAKTEQGNTSKNGAIHSKTQSKIEQDTILANWVLPPAFKMTNNYNFVDFKCLINH